VSLQLQGSKVAVTGATGLIGRALVAELGHRGAKVVAIGRDPARAQAVLGAGVEAALWQPGRALDPQVLAGCAAVVNLAGEPIDQRWTKEAKQRISESRVERTEDLVAAIAEVDEEERPRALISASAIGYYGKGGAEPIDEDDGPGVGFLPEICVRWEIAAATAKPLGVRVAYVRTGVVLDREGGALARMLPFFKAGVGGPIGLGRHYISWVHLDDVVGIYLLALENDRIDGGINATAPAPVTNADFTRALGKVLHRPAFLPIPSPALYALYGKMASIVTTGARVLPTKALVHGYTFRYPELEGALQAIFDGEQAARAS